MKRDISSRKDIELLVDAFYTKVLADQSISFFFTRIVPVDFEKHLPVMYDFWENIVFHTGAYEGNPMEKHKKIHQQHAMSAAHFERWLQLFKETVNEMYEGEKAELIKHRAISIATVMQIKFSTL